MPIQYFEKFKPFTEAAWEAFPDCESENPLVAYCEIGPSTGRMAITTVIDGRTVTVVCGGCIYRRTVPSAELAQDFARLVLASSPTFSERRLPLLFGEPVGWV